jgi:hypothetical protein
MRWIVLSIVLFIAGYTVVNLRYRKPSRAFQPYEQARERAGLAQAGFQTIPAKSERPADPRFGFSDASFAVAAGGLPSALLTALPVLPPLPAEIGQISAASTASGTLPYLIQFSCALPDNHRELGGAQLYLKNGDIFIVPDIERLPGALLSRTRENVILLTLSPGTLPAGRYHATLIGERASKSWTFDLR